MLELCPSPMLFGGFRHKPVEELINHTEISMNTRENGFGVSFIIKHTFLFQNPIPQE